MITIIKTKKSLLLLSVFFQAEDGIRYYKVTGVQTCALPISVLDIQSIVRRLREFGIGILITDHNVRETLKITDRAYIINNGEILRAGEPAELSSDPDRKSVV